MNHTPLPLEWSARLALDRAHVWHPFTQMKEHETDPPIPVAFGEGCDLVLADGRRVLDGISSWWTNIHGHGHPRLIEALARQGAKLDHVIFAGFTHEPAVELASRLHALLPVQLARCFFSDNGSTAVEVALKMAFQAQLQRGEKGRNRFGALRGGYHGDTLGAVGVGELDNFLTGLFKPLLMACERLEVMDDPRHEIAPDLSDWPERLDTARGKVRSFFAEHGERLAAFIAEPLVQGAAGMRFWPKEVLQEIRRQCDLHRVYLIHDEVMTAFGRTGSLFAGEQADVVPDLLCLSKGLGGGILPLALTWATEEIYGHFWGDYTEWKTFFHGHSFTANPMACAVANASLDIFQEEASLARAQVLARAMRDAWAELVEHPAVRHARTLGCIAACQVLDPRSGEPYSPETRWSWRFHREALNHRLLIRPLGDCLYLMPPLVTSPERIHESVRTIKRLLG